MDSLGDPLYGIEELAKAPFEQDDRKCVDDFFAACGAVKTLAGHQFVDCPTFERMCIRELQFQLAHGEVLDIFRSADTDCDGYVSCSEFLAQLATGRHRVLLRSLLHVFRMHQFNKDYTIPAQYDFSKPTNDPVNNYGSTSREYFGPFQDVRERLDFEYHGNYTKSRQMWQDTVISSMMMRSEPKPMPWLVYTCGGYGTGKGFSLAWMSEHGVFPLADMVCIDPDHFKRVMPEWQHYLKSGKDAGTLCHAESGYMEEIVQALAMRNRQNVWIDGSLWNTEWYKGVFQDLQERYPHYRIAIFYIFASEAKARQRIEARKRSTGRGIPPEAITKSHEGAKSSVIELTPYVDFVARIDNDGDTPILRSVEVVDRSGSWVAIARRFAQQQPRDQDFPRGMAPLSLRPLPPEAIEAMSFLPHEGKVKLDLEQLCASPGAVPTEEATYLQAHLPSILDLDASAACPVTPDLEMRRLAGIPETGDTDVVFIYQMQSAAESDPLRTKEFSKASKYSVRAGFPALVELLKYGGFAYLDSNTGVVKAASCISKRPGTGMLQFGPRRPLPGAAHTALSEAGRWRPVTLGRLQAARSYCWIDAGERVAGEPLGGSYGAFAYELEDGEAWVFQVAPFIQDSSLLRFRVHQP